jgi:deoxyribose-phosphate aldolase
MEILRNGGPMTDQNMDFSTNPDKLSNYIDHTLLKPEAPVSSFDALCQEAIQYGFKAVCVNSCWVTYAADSLRDKGIAVCSVVGFPLGAMHSAAKAYEAERAVKDGATELDMVLNVGALKSGDIKSVEADIRAVRQVAAGPVVLKVIIETCLLSDAEKRQACEIVRGTGADFVKTSTGFAGGGAAVEDVKLMREVVGSDMGVKASGGIRDRSTAISMIEAGASRLGTSSGVAIVENRSG